MAKPQENVEEDQRRLRGAPRDLLQPSSFSQMPHCTALEGKQLKDVGVVCGRGRSFCRVVVLHSNGRRLTECPLYSSWGTVLASQPPELAEEAEEEQEEGEAPSSDRP